MHQRYRSTGLGLGSGYQLLTKGQTRRVKNCIATLALESEVHVEERHYWFTAKPLSTKKTLCSPRVCRSQALRMEMRSC